MPVSSRTPLLLVPLLALSLGSCSGEGEPTQQEPADSTDAADTADTSTPNDSTQTVGDETATFEELGGATLASLSDECDDVPGLTAQALLEGDATANAMTFSWYDPMTAAISAETTVDVEVEFQEGGNISCIPAAGDEDSPRQLARVGYDGVVMSFQTADGLLDETGPAVAWLVAEGDQRTLSFVLEQGALELDGSFVSALPSEEDRVLMVARQGEEQTSGKVSVTKQPAGQASSAGRFTTGILYGRFPVE